jgi:hypothetical protein
VAVVRGAKKAAESATVRSVVWRTVHLHLGLRVDPYSPKMRKVFKPGEIESNLTFRYGTQPR